MQLGARKRQNEHKSIRWEAPALNRICFVVMPRFEFPETLSFRAIASNQTPPPAKTARNLLFFAAWCRTLRLRVWAVLAADHKRRVRSSAGGWPILSRPLRKGGSYLSSKSEVRSSTCHAFHRPLLGAAPFGLKGAVFDLSRLSVPTYLPITAAPAEATA